MRVFLIKNVLIAFSLAMLTFLMLFILLAFGKVELSDTALGALAGVMVALIRLMTVLVKQLGHQKRRQN
ncbi:hypothetical protein I6M76_01520 [Citrobacter cronae]|uniref:hypothetical protein n=1 Tax=Citrobacter cronae TaxID=1748967 RepID=UPI0019006BBA|nr:hypothetical protein [Citrobacter cronae]MBJ8361282.1 hypothetical protein [Citrobacter cronae]